jgi:hypothetical protein
LFLLIQNVELGGHKTQTFIAFLSFYKACLRLQGKTLFF